MKRFTRRVLAFTFLLVTFLLTTFLINYCIINNSQYFKLPQNIETIVVGHSHPECAYDDSLISEFKNIAQSGEAYFYTYLKVKKILTENEQVKNVLIEFEPSQTDTAMNAWTWDEEHLGENLVKYIPLLDYPAFSLLWQNNYRGMLNTFPKSFIKKAGYNFLFVLLMRKDIQTDHQFGGYQFLKRDKTDSILKARPALSQNQEGKGMQEISHTNLHYLAQIIKYCRQKRVQVFLIRSPLHTAYNDSVSERQFKIILNTNFPQTQFLDLRNFPLQNDQYGDLGHLNYRGAKPYSIFFDHLLKMNLLQRENKQAIIEAEIAKINWAQNIQNK